MMLDPKSYRKEFEEATLEKVLQERDRIVEFMQDFENDKLPKKYFERDTTPEEVYLLNIDYLKEICDLIKVKMPKKEEEPKEQPPVMFCRKCGRKILSKFGEEKQKEFLEDLKEKDKLLYYEFMEWKNGQ